MILLDTHALVWWAVDSDRLSAAARRAIRAESGRRAVHASAMSLFEIATSVRRGRMDLGMPLARWLSDLRQLKELEFDPVVPEIAELAGTFGEDLPGDPADRIIAATAVVLGAKLVTADARMRRAANLEIVW